MAKCSACGKFLSSSGAAACVSCPCLFHKACVAMPDNITVAKDWVCPECTRKHRKSDNSCTPVKNVCGVAAPPITEAVAADAVQPEVNRNLSSLSFPPLTIESLMKELRDFREEFRASIVGLGKRMDGFERRLEAVEQRESVATTDPQVSKLQQAVVQLQLELNERDQDAFLSDLDIGHLPEEKGENVHHSVVVLAAKLGITIEERDIVFAERAGPARSGASGAQEAGRARRVVVRFARRHLRDEFLRAARVRRNFTTGDIGLTGPPHRVYVNERLTRVNRQLFYQVREECKKQQWRYSWTKRGRIYVRRGDGHQVHQVRTQADIMSVFKPENV